MSGVRTFRAESIHASLELVRQEMGSEAVILGTRQISQRRLLPWTRGHHEVEITAAVEQAGRRRRRQRRPATIAATLPAAASETPPADRRPAGTRETRSARPTTTLASRSLPQSLSGRSTEFTAIRPSSSSEPATSAAIGQKLDAIQQALNELRGKTDNDQVDQTPRELVGLYSKLIEAEVEEDLARELIARLQREAAPDQLADETEMQSLLSALMESQIRCSGALEPGCGSRKVVALVGPTGVGKTTTLAKLAANYRLRNGIKMGLVTVDTYRIAAVEQIRTYAEIIDLPMKVVTSPRDMRRALDELLGLDLVLIDTAGRSPHDELKIQELKSLLAEAQPDEVHLVLSLTASPRSLQVTAEKFAAANATATILTKLDETNGLGPVLSVAKNVPLPISYITTGQDVPADIEPANATRLARLVLGEDQLGG